MKKFKIIFGTSVLFFISAFVAQPIFAQGDGGSLTFQGLDHFTMHSAAARAMGGVTIGIQQDVGLMFQNPAALHSIEGIQLTLGGLLFSRQLNQEQNFAPVRYYPNLSLLLEGLTTQIPDPDTSLVGFSPQDTVQRPYDDLKPNWSRADDDNLPLQIFIAAPVLTGKFKIVAGIGAVTYADLNHYYQNNNVLSPSILSQRPLPTLRPTDDNPVEVAWMQSIRSRDGYIQGYGFALAGSMEEFNLSVGFSGMILEGSSDDYEREVHRGDLTFFSNAFRVDSVFNTLTKTGTSDFSGQEFSLSSIITSRYISLGFSIKFPTTITRSYSMDVITDTSGTGPALSRIKGEDKMKLPWRGTIGLSITPKENLTLGLEYEFRPYKSAQYINTDGTETSPWLPASLFRIGIEYSVASWLALRCGMRGDAEVFEPEGNYIQGEAPTYTVYSAGFGVSYSGLRLNVTYENARMKYQDVWASALSKNSEKRYAIIAQLTYHIPWIY